MRLPAGLFPRDVLPLLLLNGLGQSFPELCICASRMILEIVIRPKRVYSFLCSVAPSTQGPELFLLHLGHQVRETLLQQLYLHGFRRARIRRKVGVWPLQRCAEASIDRWLRPGNRPLGGLLRLSWMRWEHGVLGLGLLRRRGGEQARSLSDWRRMRRLWQHLRPLLGLSDLIAPVNDGLVHQEQQLRVINAWSYTFSQLLSDSRRVVFPLVVIKRDFL